MTILPLEEDGARKAAEIRRTLVSRGADIGMADSLIAGACLSVGGMLLTRNRRHFERIDGLKLATTSEG